MKRRKNFVKFIAWTMLALVLAGCVADAPGSGNSNPAGTSVPTNQTTLPGGSQPESTDPNGTGETTTQPTGTEQTVTPTTQPSEAPTTEPTQTPTTEPTQVPTTETTQPTESEPTGDGIVFVEWPETISQGSTATVTIKGEPNTTYSIKVYIKSGTSSAKGLEDKVSDANGYVTWTWKISSRTSTGDFKIIVTGGDTVAEVPYSITKK